MTLDEAIKVAEAATPGPLDPQKAAECLARVMESVSYDDNRTSFNLYHMKAVLQLRAADLRALKLAREAMKSMHYVHYPSNKIGQALAAISALYPEETTTGGET